MNILHISLFLFTSLFIFDSCAKKGASTYQNINAQDAKEIFSSSKEVIFLDVRTPEEIAEGKIEGAMEIDYRDENFSDQIAKLEKDETYIVYCRSGRRSAEASEIMTNLGFSDVTNLEGGILAWNEVK